MQKEIPKPIVQKKLKEDTREKYLREWKKLFESIDPDIQVHLHTEEHFGQLLQRTLPSLGFGWKYIDNARILILLGERIPTYEYFVGITYNQMYSDVEIANDLLIQEDDSFDCEPETKEWSFFYTELCKKIDERSTEIPEPK